MKQFKVMLLAVLALAIVAFPQAAKAGEAGGTNSLVAPKIELGQEYTVDYDNNRDAMLNVTGEDSFFAVDVPSDGTYVVTFKSAGDNMCFKFLDSDNNVLASDYYMDHNGKKYELKLNAGTYYFDVYTDIEDESYGIVSIAKKKTPATDLVYDTNEDSYTDDDNDIEGSHNFIDAPRLALGTEFTMAYNDATGTNINITDLGDGNNSQIFKFIVTKKAQYVLKFKSAGNENGTFEFRDANYTKVESTYYMSNRSYIKMLTLTPGTYYVRFWTDDENFMGSFSLTDTTIKIKSITAGTKALTVKWSKFFGVSGYELRYSTYKNMKNAVTVDLTASKVSTTLKKLKADKTYYVQIRPYVKDADGNKLYGAWSNKASKKVK